MILNQIKKYRTFHRYNCYCSWFIRIKYLKLCHICLLSQRHRSGVLNVHSIHIIWNQKCILTCNIHSPCDFGTEKNKLNAIFSEILLIFVPIFIFRQRINLVVPLHRLNASHWIISDETSNIRLSFVEHEVADEIQFMRLTNK